MCRENYGRKKGDEKSDPKLLKEACSAVKEAAAVVSGLEKNEKNESEVIEIIFSGNTEDFCR